MYVFGLFVMQIIPSILLIYSIARLRKTIKKFDSSQFIMKETLMTIHTAIYLTYIISSFTSTIMQQLSKAKYYDEEDYKTACRMQVVQRIANDLLWTVCIAMVLL